VIVAAMRILDHGSRALLAPLVRLDTSWTRDQRQDAFDQLNDFVRDFRIVLAIRQSARTITELLRLGGLDDDFRFDVELPVERIVSSGIQMIALMNPGLEHLEFRYDDDELAKLWSKLANTQSNEELRAIATEIQERIPKTHFYVMTAEEAFGEIKGVVLHRYPLMPIPQWAE
jgi:hypothetical protein